LVLLEARGRRAHPDLAAGDEDEAMAVTGKAMSVRGADPD